MWDDPSNTSTATMQISLGSAGGNRSTQSPARGVRTVRQADLPPQNQVNNLIFEIHFIVACESKFCFNNEIPIFYQGIVRVQNSIRCGPVTVTASRTPVTTHHISAISLVYPIYVIAYMVLYQFSITGAMDVRL